MCKQIKNDLDSLLNRILDACKGLETPLNFFYETKKGLRDLEPVSTELTETLSERIDKSDKEKYLCFFKIAISFLEAACLSTDRKLSNIKKISTVMFPEGAKFSTFHYMLEDAPKYISGKTDRAFLDICFDEHKKFEKYIKNGLDIKIFLANVDYAISKFASNKDLCISQKEYEDSAISATLDVAFDHIVSECRSIKEKVLYER